MMAATQRNGEFIADLAPKCTSLGKAQVVRIAGSPAADKTRLLSDMPDVLAIAHPARTRGQLSSTFPLISGC